MTDYTSEEFWKGAPEASTHYQPPRAKGCNPVFWMVKNGVPVEAWAVISGGKLHHISDPRYEEDIFDKIIPRPAQPWSGDGLPPVGTVCECRVKTNSPWVQCEVVAHHKQHAIAYVDDDTVMLSCGIRFRPIKTPAQIAAEEREAAIKAMWEIYWQPSATSAKQALGLLWDAGLRLPKGEEQ